MFLLLRMPFFCFRFFQGTKFNEKERKNKKKQRVKIIGSLISVFNATKNICMYEIFV